MEAVFQITALCVVASILSLVVKRGSWELSILVSLAAIVVVLFSVGQVLGDVAAFLKELGERSGVSRELFVPLYKTVAIALVVKWGGNLCRDAGESALAAALEVSGTVCALAVALPLLHTVLDLLLEFME